MLSTIIRTEAGRQRHLATPLGPYLDRYLSHRRDQGFAAATIAGDLKSVTAFGEYLVEKAVVSVARLTDNDLEAFVAYYQSHPRRHGPARRTARGSVAIIESLRGTLRSVLAYLRTIGATAPACSDKPPTPYGAVLAEYLSFLRQHRGFADVTVEHHGRYCSFFFAELSRTRPQMDLAELEVADVEATTVTLAQKLGRRSRQIMTTTVESLMRYLRGAGHVSPSCVPFLPRMKTYALSSLPSVIPWDDVERAIARIDRGHALGRRNYAMVLLVAMYGLRAAEVVELRLGDIAWRQGVIHVRQSKTRRTLNLPLMPSVRDALIDYLRNDRGTTIERRIFLKVHAPRGPISRTILYDVVCSVLKKAGVDAAHFGPHALRHARATSLIRSGRSLKTIGDLLGHRVPEATLMYCKVAVEELRSVALELPGVSS